MKNCKHFINDGFLSEPGSCALKNGQSAFCDEYNCPLFPGKKWHLPDLHVFMPTKEMIEKFDIKIPKGVKQ